MSIYTKEKWMIDIRCMVIPIDLGQMVNYNYVTLTLSSHERLQMHLKCQVFKIHMYSRKRSDCSY